MTENPVRPLLRRDKAAIMGIINATPDSFSDGGQFNSIDRAVAHGLSLVEQGADILDIGGESTRPGAQKVGLQQELDRVIPVIEKLNSHTAVPISIDTYKPDVMREAIAVGAQMVNDVNGLRSPGAVEVVAVSGVIACVMHMQGQPEDMQSAPVYYDVIDDVIKFFEARIAVCQKAGIHKTDLLIDPGIGFGKTLAHNLSLLNAVPKIQRHLGVEMLIGVSRKSMIDKVLGRPIDERLPASLGLAVQAVINGAKFIRVHDVQATYDAVRIIERVRHWEKYHDENKK